MAQGEKIARSIKLYEDFTGHTAGYIDEYHHSIPTVGVLIGKCDGILYTTVRDGKTEKYIHKFKAKSRPLLAASFDGSSMIMLEGAYQFTERGIVDK